jgi:transcription elongation factor GreB
MSKAFTRESDERPDPPPALRLAPPLPPGARNYLTAGGAKRLRDELDHLLQDERPKAISSSDTAAGGQLHALDQRIQHLRQSLQSAVIVNPPAGPENRVRFGATVTVRGPDGKESQYRIVGIDEIDIDRGWVSWLSPIAKALLNARLGERVQFRFPSGEEELDIVKIVYE